MSGALSRRQQARNEKALHELVHNVPGNNICADCHTPNPAWASWSLGVFLCMRCAAIHRKLGTHISKVKSLSMDSWSNEQVDNMRKVGNIASNQIYNASNKQPPVPVDADEADSAMERFIRQKYTNNVAVSRSSAGKPRTPLADEGTPPPLPPKNSTSKFGFKSASSIFPLSSKSKKEAKHAAAMQQAYAQQGHHTSPPPPDKPSQLFGASVGVDSRPDTERKLAQLKDMGFQDSGRNAIVLKGVHGNLEKAVEALVRLGEGGARSPGAAPMSAARVERTLRTSKSMTPMTSGSSGLGIDFSSPNGTPHNAPPTPSSASTNPFDMMPPAQPQTAQSTGTLQNKNPYNSPTVAATQSNDFFTQAFQNMSLNNQPQSLFPNHTGGGQMQNQPFQQPATMASAPSSPQNYQLTGFQTGTMYSQPSPLAQQPTGYNPYMSAPTSPVHQMPTQQPLALNTGQMQGNFANNPFARSPTGLASPSSLGQIPEQTQSTTFQSPVNYQPSPSAGNPFFNSQIPSPAPQINHNPYGQSPYAQPQYNQAQYSQPQYSQQQQQQYAQPQYAQPQRVDNASIMALFGQGMTSPTKSVGSEPQFPHTQVSSIPEDAAAPSPVHGTMTMPPNQHQQHQQWSAQTTSNNPFMNNNGTAGTAANSEQFASARNVSRDSVNLGMDLAWTNGRHSPDAFASLSARHV